LNARVKVSTPPKPDLAAISSIDMALLVSHPAARCRRSRRTIAATVSPRMA
jgi:hypothetical protein